MSKIGFLSKTFSSRVTKNNKLNGHVRSDYNFPNFLRNFLKLFPSTANSFRLVGGAFITNKTRWDAHKNNEHPRSLVCFYNERGKGLRLARLVYVDNDKS